MTTVNRNENRQTENKQRRVPVGGLRDILAVFGKDPDKHYHFVKDSNEGGMRIQTFLRGGYEFTQTGEHSTIIVGEECVYQSKKSKGSIIRFPVEANKHGSPQWLHLMEIKKEWYDEDMANQQKEIDELESTITGKKSPDDNDSGQYGQVKIERKSGK